MQQPDSSRSQPTWATESVVPVHLLGVVRGDGFRPYLAGFVALMILVVLGGYAAITLSDLFATFAGVDRHSPLLRNLRNLLALGCAILFMQWVLGWQGRDLMSVIAPGRRLDGGMFLRSAATYAAAFAPMILISAYYGQINVGSLSLSLLLMLPVLVVLFIFQASAEEIVFRGYMAQGLQVLLGNAALAALPVAIFFLVLHDSGGWNVGWEQKAMFLAMSLGLSYLTWRTGRLEAAMGVHFAHNLLVTLFLARPQSGLPSVSGFEETVGFQPPDPDRLLGVLLMQGAVASSYWFLGLFSGFVEQGWRGGEEREG